MAGLIAPATLEQIRAASDIVDVIGAVLPLKRAGANFVALCPFHKERSPSFNVNPHKQIFHCFGCHKGGDVFTFVKEYENLPFVDAVRRLAERANLPLEFDQNPGQQQARHLKDTLLQIHEQIAQRWQGVLTRDAAGQAARDYLAQRGVSDDAVKLFRLGYAPDSWEDTVNWAGHQGHDLALVEKAGLIIRKEASDRYYDRFRGRLMFPICDEQGRVIGFSGRILAGDEKTAKYVNSPETPIFTKGKVFFGLDKSKRAILDAGCAIICEGQLDLIACYMSGTRNIVAPQGTAFTADHARILKRYVDEVVLCFDSDTAGQAAAVRVLDSLLASGLAIRVATVPAPHDPDSFIKERGGPAFAELIQQGLGFFDWYLGRLCATNDITKDRGRLAVVDTMSEAVLKTGNQVLIETYAQKTAQRLAVPTEAVRAEFKKRSRPKTRTNEPETEPAEIITASPRPSPLEFWLLKLLLLNDDSADWVAAHLDPEWLQHAFVRDLVLARFKAQAEHTWRGVAGLLDNCADDATRGLITEAVSDPRPIPDPEKTLKGDLAKKGILQLLRDDFVDRQLAALQQRLVQPGISDDDLVAIEGRRAHLRLLKKQPLQPLR
ncbi:MAG TPA: DNA primase [Verrucomicrobiae bacterium]|jgi:DNA primase